MYVSKKYLKAKVTCKLKLVYACFCVAGGEEWKLVADNLGLNSDEIRFLDNRTRNPADAVLSYTANGRYLSVGELYDVLNDCDLSVLADKL